MNECMGTVGLERDKKVVQFTLPYLSSAQLQALCQQTWVWVVSRSSLQPLSLLWVAILRFGVSKVMHAELRSLLRLVLSVSQG
jgi:hypothetical protein